MTTQQRNINIAIAEACGWRKLPAPPQLECGASAPDKCWYFAHQLPNFCGDLNDMAQAEKVMTAEQQYEYHCKLAGMLSATVEFRYAICATAAQRAEAFLKTIGEWKEQP